jgi:hypothetical protein
MIRPCIYFARLTVDEERAICASRVEVLRRVLAETVKWTPELGPGIAEVKV